MKIKDMIKKVEAYNELAEIVRGGKLELTFGETTQGMKITNYNYKQFSKFIRETYIKPVADAILNGEYEFGVNEVFTVTDSMGYIFHVTAGFDIYTA